MENYLTKETLAAWMLGHGFATGHGDNVEDLLAELAWQVRELRAQVPPPSKSEASANRSSRNDNEIA